MIKQIESLILTAIGDKTLNKLSLFLDYFLAIVRTALLANSVREYEFSALRALNDSGDVKLPVV